MGCYGTSVRHFSDLQFGQIKTGSNEEPALWTDGFRQLLIATDNAVLKDDLRAGGHLGLNRSS